jgi:hypothetical protein
LLFKGPRDLDPIHRETERPGRFPATGILKFGRLLDLEADPETAVGLRRRRGGCREQKGAMCCLLDGKFSFTAVEEMVSP